MVKEIEDAAAYHGSDGFGGVQESWLDHADTENVKSEHAVNAIINHVHEETKNGNEIGVPNAVSALKNGHPLDKLGCSM